MTCGASIGRIVALLTGIGAFLAGPALARAEPAAAAAALPASSVRLLVLGSPSEFAARVGGQLSDVVVRTFPFSVTVIAEGSLCRTRFHPSSNAM